MSDRHTSPSSDDLVGAARSDATDDGPDEFVPSSPVDDYVLPTSFDPADVTSDVSADLDVDSLTAEELATALLDAQPEPSAVEPDPADAAADPAQGSSSLPSWATEPSSEGAPSAAVQTPAERAVAGAASSDVTRSEVPDPEPASEFIPPVRSDTASWDEPSNEWLAYEAQQKAKQKTSRVGSIPVPRIRTIVALVVASFFLFSLVYGLVDGRDPIETARVGDCFTAGDALEIDQVAIVDCSEEHDSEVYAIIDATPVFGTSYPGEDALFDWLFDECLDHFTGYTGQSYESSRYYFDTLIPTSDAWRFGDHEGMCTLILLDDDNNLLISTSSGRRDAPDTNNA